MKEQSLVGLVIEPFPSTLSQGNWEVRSSYGTCDAVEMPRGDDDCGFNSRSDFDEHTCR
jgi:hypothetical protein